MPQFSGPPKPSQSPSKCAPDKTRTRWSNHNHLFNHIKINRYNMLGMSSMDMNKINIIQPTPKRACECLGATCSYCKHEPPHPSPVHSDWSSEDWDSEKAKAREQKSLIDFKPPKPQTDEQVTESVNKIPFSKFGNTRQARRGIARSNKHTGPTTRNDSSSPSNGCHRVRGHHGRD